MVTADPLTLSLRFAAMGELKHSFKKEAKHSFKYALLKLPKCIRSPAQTQKNPLAAGLGNKKPPRWAVWAGVEPGVTPESGEWAKENPPKRVL